MNGFVRSVVRSTLRPYLQWRAMAAAADWDFSDVNLVSYPKSGVTWVCLVLANILAGRSADGRRVDLFTAHDYVPDLHSNPLRLRTLEPPRIVKTHERFAEWSARIAVKGRGVSFPRVIYLVRDGRDVMASHYAYRAALSSRPVDAAVFYSELTASHEDWATHVQEWVVDNPALDQREVLVVRYEDARQNPSEVFGRIGEFIGLEMPQAALAGAIEYSSAARMRQLEDRFGGGVRYQNRSYRFVSEGRRVERTDAVDRILETYRTGRPRVFERFGY